VTQERIILKGVSKDFVKRSGLAIKVRGDSMKKLYVCGSFRFTHEMEELERQLKEENIQFQISKKTDSCGILGCLKKVDAADVVYIVNPQGYIGKSVSVDIGYAYAKNKSICVMHAVDDPPIMNLISDVLSPKALIDFLKERIPKGN
jgi:hypothetical protein